MLPHSFHWTLASLDDLTAFARDLASQLRPGDVLALDGPLGAGKTTLSRLLAENLGVSDAVNSPSFGLMHEYRHGEQSIYHADLYRLGSEGASDRFCEGLEPIMAAGNSMAWVEWACYAPSLAPWITLAVHLDFADSLDGPESTPQEGRRIRVTANRPLTLSGCPHPESPLASPASRDNCSDKPDNGNSPERAPSSINQAGMPLIRRSQSTATNQADKTDNPAGITQAPILYLDTTGTNLVVGISREGRLLASRAEPCDSNRYHSARMMPLIHATLEESALRARDLAAVAVTSGPGSFTSIRTGLITARTLAQFLPAPLYPLTRFHLLAWQAWRSTSAHNSPSQSEHPLPNTIAICLDALRGRTYHAIMTLTEEGLRYEREPCLLDLADVANTLPPGLPVLASRSLEGFWKDFFDPMQPAPQWIEPDTVETSLETPALMLELLRHHGASLQRSWRDALPLYIQEPSVTLKKNAPKHSVS